MYNYIKEKNEIIKSYKDVIVDYGEIHHIKLCSMCKVSNRYGTRDDYVYPIDADSVDNLIKVTIADHLKLHWLEYKIWGCADDRPAKAFMLKYNTILSGVKCDLGDLDISVYDTDYECAKKQIKKTKSNGDYSTFNNLPPWESKNASVNDIVKWEMMPTLYRLWLHNNKPKHRRFSKLIIERFGLNVRTDGMLNIFDNDEKYSKILAQWLVWIGCGVGFNGKDTAQTIRHNRLISQENIKLKDKNIYLSNRNNALLDKLNTRDQIINHLKSSNASTRATNGILRNELTVIKRKNADLATPSKMIVNTQDNYIYKKLHTDVVLGADSLKVKRNRWKNRLIRDGLYEEFLVMVGNLFIMYDIPNKNCIYNLNYNEIWECKLFLGEVDVI